MAPAPLSIIAWNQLCLKSEGRDKLARFGQYAARFLVGLTSKARMGTPMRSVYEKALAVMVQLAGARRAHRWCKEFPVLQGIPKSLTIANPIDMLLEVCQKATLATFMIIDHIGYLKQVKILKGGKRAGAGTIQLGLSWFALSNFISLLIQGKKLYKLTNNDDGKKDADAKETCIKQSFKHAALVVQMAHISRRFETHDAVVGFLGMITSIQDVIPQWPQAPKEDKIDPDAKAMPKPKTAAPVSNGASSSKPEQDCLVESK